MDFDNGDLDDGIAGLDGFNQVVQTPQPHILTNSIQGSHIESGESIEIVCIAVCNSSSALVVEFLPSPSLAGTTKSMDLQTVADAPRSPPVELAIQHAYRGLIRPENNGATLRRAKRARPVLDVRTELTDEELKVRASNSTCFTNFIRLEATRMYYLNKQNTIRCELEFKRFEKRQADMIHSLLWDAPGSGKPSKEGPKSKAKLH